MSTTYDLVCLELKLKLWVGQSDYIYSDLECVKNLGRFLHATKGKPLYFISEHQETILSDGDVFDCDYFSETTP